MGSFFKALGNGFKAVANWAPQGSDAWANTQRAKQGQEQIDLQQQQEQRLQQQQDLEFAQHMQSLGARPVFHGLVREDIPTDVDQSHGVVSEDMPIPMGYAGNSVRVYRPPNPDRQIIKQKTAEGDHVQWEVPTPEEQMARGIRSAYGTAQAQTQGTGAGKTQAEIADREQRGMLPTPEQVKQFGLNPNQKYLPEEISTMGRYVLPAQIRQDTALQTTGMRTRSAQEIADANRAAQNDRQSRMLAFQTTKAQNDEALKDAVSQRAAAVQSGANPGLGAVKLRSFNNAVATPLSMREQADQEQQRIFDAEKLLNPEETPDGQQIVNPWTNEPMTMGPGVRAILGRRAIQAQGNADVMRSQSENVLRDLGVKLPSAKSNQSGGASAAPSGAAAPGGNNPSPAGGGGQKPPEQADAEDLLNHRLSPSQLMSQIGGRGMQKTAYVNRVKQNLRRMDPDFSWEDAESNYHFTKSPQFQNTVRYMDSVQDSLPRLMASATTLNNGKIRSLNSLVNAGKSQFNDVDLKRFQTDRLLVADEVAKIIQGGGTGGGTSDAKLKQASDLLRDSDDPSAIATALGEIRPLIGFRRASLTRGTSLGLPEGKGATLDKDTAIKFYAASGSDPDGARQLAKQYGWKVQ